MRQERHIGYEVKALSNLLRRKVLEMTGSTDGDDFTEMQVKILGFLCHNQDQEVCQKDIEEAFYIRRSTASRALGHFLKVLASTSRRRASFSSLTERLAMRPENWESIWRTSLMTRMR